MKSLFQSLAITVCLLPLAARGNQIINISAYSPTGISIPLAAGSYQVSVIGTEQGGKYNAWNFATANEAPAANAWLENFTITFDGLTRAYFPAGEPLSSSALAALALSQNSVLYVDSLWPASQLIDVAPFTLTSSQIVTFRVGDYLFPDNWGGVSLSLTSVPSTLTPEPSTFGMLGLAFVGGLLALRRKQDYGYCLSSFQIKYLQDFVCVDPGARDR